MKEISGGTHMLRTGYAIPLVGLGTYKLSGELMKRAVDAALSVGYRLFDTAKFYFNEADLGEALEISLRRHNLTREDVFITTKIYPTSCEDFYEEIRGILEKSLSDLRTRYVDLVLIHFPKTKDATTNDPANAFHRRNTYLALEKLKSEGMLRSVGVSNYEIRHMEEIKRYAQDMPAVNQVEFHPHFTRVQLRDYCVGNNIFFQAYSSLARHNQELLEHKNVLQIAMKYGTSAPIILLSWALSQEVGVIPKSSQPQRIEENLKATEIKLSKAEVHLLESLNKDRNYVRMPEKQKENRKRNSSQTRQINNNDTAITKNGLDLLSRILFAFLSFPNEMSSLKNVKGGAFKLNTGYYIPLFGFGTYTVTEKEVKHAVNEALRCGYRLFDTARYYENEAELGEALEDLLPKYGLTREDVFITTKFHIDPDDPAGGARRLVLNSLVKLKVSYIDMVLIHYPKALKCDDKDEKNKLHRKLTYLELEKLKEEGKIRSVGVSNYEISHIEEIKEYSKMIPCSDQVEFHPHFTREELRQYCKKKGIFLQAFSSMARFAPTLVNEPVLVDIAKRRFKTIILLSFAVSQGVGVVPRSIVPREIRENFEATKLVLDGEEIELLKKLNRNHNYIRCTGWLVE
ncbi:hypothetical protein RB195_002614 [Necator americanus]|uniref:NADP-dependent oxidoreductase domain-containing protein n=1 Tax=Necator americanus TaxID=51031 RepID=A0ABR1DLA2_NECAM